MESGFESNQPQPAPSVYQTLLGYELSDQELDDASYNLIVPSVSEILEKLELLAGVEIIGQTELLDQKTLILRLPDGTILILHEDLLKG